MKQDDVIMGEILPDGTVKITTGNLEGSNHKSADDFVKELALDLGGEVEKEKRGNHGHSHKLKPKFA